MSISDRLIEARLTYFDKGKIVTAIEKDGDWYLIKRIYSDTTCWVHQNDLKPVRWFFSNHVKGTYMVTSKY